jgi:hypothetical protein
MPRKTTSQSRVVQRDSPEIVTFFVPARKLRASSTGRFSPQPGLCSESIHFAQISGPFSGMNER